MLFVLTIGSISIPNVRLAFAVFEVPSPSTPSAGRQRGRHLPNPYQFDPFGHLSSGSLFIICIIYGLELDLPLSGQEESCQ